MSRARAQPPKTTASGLARMLRIGNLPTLVTNGLAAALLCEGSRSPWAWTAATLSLSLFYLAGMGLNDLWDQAWDREHRPERPLPSGQVTPGAAWATTLGSFALGFLILTRLPAPGPGLLSGMGLAVAILAYDAFHKGNPLSPLLMGACRALGILTVAMALGGELTLGLGLAMGGQLLWVLALTAVAKLGGAKARRVFPWLLAGISGVDGLVLAVMIHPAWLLLGLAGLLMTRVANLVVPGD